jgi:DHA1 family bicyclomycin/chloramphenicol resistance-like MFS transporter
MSRPASVEVPAAKIKIPRHLILFIGALVAIGPLSLDAYLPAMPAMADAFHVNIVSINNTISVYLVGYGFGQFFGGAFSDQIGRKRVGLIGLLVFALASIAIGFATNVAQVEWLRFTQAIGGGFSTVICWAIVRDVYHVDELGKRMAMVTLVMLASPVIAPSLGAALLHLGWPAIFFFKATYAGALATFYLFAVPETRPGAWRNLSVLTTLRQCGQVLARKDERGRRPIVFGLAMALAAACFMTFLTNASFAYIEYFGISATVFPLYFGIGVVGMIATNIYSMRHMTPVRAPWLFRLGLIVQLVAASFLAAEVLLGPRSSWVVVACVAVIVGTFGLAGPAGSSLYMRHFDRLAGSASSLYTTTMFAMGSIFGAISGFFFDGTLRPMVTTMLAASVAANLIALRTGARLGRQRSAIEAGESAARSAASGA